MEDVSKRHVYVRRMLKSEIDLIRRAVELLRRVVPDDGEPCAVDPAPRRCPVNSFAKHYLHRDPASDLSSLELWEFYAEVAASGELERLSKAEFLRRIPGVMQASFGVNKCHNIQRDGRAVRGFKSVGIRENIDPPRLLELEPEAV